MRSARELFLYKNPSKEPSLTLTYVFPLKSFKALQQLSHLNHQQVSVGTSRHSPCSGGTEARGSTWSSATPQPKPQIFASQSSASATQPLLCPDRAVLWRNCTPAPALEVCWAEHPAPLRVGTPEQCKKVQMKWYLSEAWGISPSKATKLLLEQPLPLC